MQQNADYVEMDARKQRDPRYQAASGSGHYLMKDPYSSKDRSSGHQGIVKSGAQGTGTNGHHNRGQSTDDSSLNKPASKSNSEISVPADISQPYVKVKLTKDVLHAFEE